MKTLRWARMSPITTAYSIAEGVGKPASLDQRFAAFPVVLWGIHRVDDHGGERVSIVLILACVSALGWIAGRFGE